MNKIRFSWFFKCRKGGWYLWTRSWTFWPSFLRIGPVYSQIFVRLCKNLLNFWRFFYTYLSNHWELSTSPLAECLGSGTHPPFIGWKIPELVPRGNTSQTHGGPWDPLEIWIFCDQSDRQSRASWILKSSISYIQQIIVEITSDLF